MWFGNVWFGNVWFGNGVVSGTGVAVPGGEVSRIGGGLVLTLGNGVSRMSPGRVAFDGQ